jgi:hypothetical protein
MKPALWYLKYVSCLCSHGELRLDKLREVDLIDRLAIVANPDRSSLSFTQDMHNALCYVVRSVRDSEFLYGKDILYTYDSINKSNY